MTHHFEAAPADDATLVALPRRGFLRVGAAAGGGLLLGVGWPGLMTEALGAEQSRSKKPAEAAVGQAATRVSNEAPRLQPSAFIRIDRSGEVSFIVHKVEMGQGTFTSIPMLLAEELEVDLAKVKLEQAPPDNDHFADPLLGGQVTGGSTSIRGAWMPLRQAGATARTMLVAAAADTWKVDPATCSAANGVVTHGPTKRHAHYGELVDKAVGMPVPKDVKLKEPKDFKLIGKAVKRLDSGPKTDGTALFGIDVRRPGMGIAAVAASPVFGGKLAGTDDAKALAVKGVRQVVKLDDAVAVVGDHMWAAKQGLAALNPRWTEGANASFDNAALVQAMDTASKGANAAVARHDGDAAKAFAAGAKKVEAVYQLPFLAHATMEPINCTVEIGADGCDLWLGTQVPTFAQGAAAKITGLPVAKVRVHNHYLGGGFGRRLEVDSVVQAVQFAKQVKGPVKFVWSREEDIQHDMYRPYYYDRLSGAIDADGKPVAWSHRVTGSSILARFAPPAVVNGVDPDAVEGAKDIPYAIPNVHVDYVRHEPPVPTAFWRGVGPTHNIFVVESFIDELAAAAGKDPFDYRRGLLAKAPRQKAVLELAAQKAGWNKPLSAAADGARIGRGISVQFAFGSYMSQVAEVAVSNDGEVRVTRVVCAVDCGQVVNPDTVRAQLEGGILFAMSAALWGQITFANGRVQQTNFGDYRVARMNESPPIEVHIVPSSEAPGGLGEPGTAAFGPALANAVFAATGQRARKLPIEAQMLKAV